MCHRFHPGQGSPSGLCCFAGTKNPAYGLDQALLFESVPNGPLFFLGLHPVASPPFKVPKAANVAPLHSSTYQRISEKSLYRPFIPAAYPCTPSPLMGNKVQFRAASGVRFCQVSAGDRYSGRNHLQPLATPPAYLFIGTSMGLFPRASFAGVYLRNGGRGRRSIRPAVMWSLRRLSFIGRVAESQAFYLY